MGIRILQAAHRRGATSLVSRFPGARTAPKHGGIGPAWPPRANGLLNRSDLKVKLARDYRVFTQSRNITSFNDFFQDKFDTPVLGSILG